MSYGAALCIQILRFALDDKGRTKGMRCVGSRCFARLMNVLCYSLWRCFARIVTCLWLVRNGWLAA